MFWYRHQRPKNKKNTITIRACLGLKNSPELEVQIKPKKLIKDFPFFASLVRKKEKRNLLVFEGGPLRRYGELVNKCLSTKLKIHPIPLNIRNLIRIRNARIDCFQVENVNQRLWKHLYPFQKEGVKRAISRNYGKILFCDEMGLGKSLQSLTVADYYRKRWPLLILCPSYLRFNWEHELLKWKLEKKENIQIIQKGSDDLREDARVIIISYDLASRLEKQLHAFNFQVAIADESHYIKNRKAKRTKICLPLLKKCKRCLLLTGTPALSRPEELFTQLSCVAPTTFHYFNQFAERYCDAKMGHFGWDVSGCSNEEELQLINHYCMVRRLKKNVLTELPPKIREDILVSLNNNERKALEPGFNELREINHQIYHGQHDQEQMSNLFFTRKQLISSLFRETALVKTNIVREYLKNLLPMRNNQKLIVFGYHRIMLDAIQEAVEAKKCKFIRIDGSTPQKDRMGLVATFAKPHTNIAILSIGACGTGFNFTMCSHIIFAELLWNPGELLQAEDRIHRIGQKASSILIQYMIADGSLDNTVWKRLKEKFSTLDKVLNDQNKGGFESMDIKEEIERDTIELDFLLRKDPKKEQFYQKTLAKFGINQHFLKLGQVWFPPKKILGTTIAYQNVPKHLKQFIQRVGTPTSCENARLLLLRKETTTTENPIPIDHFYNLSEFKGDLEKHFFSQPKVQYFILNDVPTKLKEEEALLHCGISLVFAFFK